MSRFAELSPAFLDELRDRVTLSTLVGRTVKLQKAGNEWKGLCPFHQEKTASFWINDLKAFYHCFGCGAHGDAMKWLMESRGLAFLDAVRELCDAVGLDMPAPDPAQAARLQRDSSLHDVMAQAADLFADQLAGAGGERARAYLTSRGVTADQVRRFRIGFAPDSRGWLRQALRSVGDDDLVACGLLIAVDGAEPYDRFRSRIMFPIRDPRGRIVSFGGRILGQGEPKYLNGPDTVLFDKGRTLFNLDQAGPIARKGGRIVAVEGYIDALALDRVGIAEAVAPMGTALTEAQLGWLWRVSDTPVLCLDGDAAGRKAAVRAAVRALPMLAPNKSLQFALLPEGQDPDDLARSGKRPALDAVIKRAMPLHDLLWSHEYFAAPLDTPEARAGLSKRLQDHAETIQDPDVRREYAALFRERMFPAWRRRNPQAPPPPAALEQLTFSAEAVRRKMVVAVFKGLARFPDVLASEVERVAEILAEDDSTEQAKRMLFDAAFRGEAIAPADFGDLFPDERGWKGFVMSFNRAPADAAAAERARADLVRALDIVRGEEVEPLPERDAIDA